MPEYIETFKRILKEDRFNVPNIKRNPNDVKFEDEASSEDFDVRPMDDYNTDPNDPNVGFGSENIERDKETIIDVYTKLKDMHGLSEVASKLKITRRTFDESSVDKLVKDIADIDKELGLTIETLKFLMDYNNVLNDQEDMEPETEEY